MKPSAIKLALTGSALSLSAAVLFSSSVALAQEATGSVAAQGNVAPLEGGNSAAEPAPAPAAESEAAPATEPAPTAAANTANQPDPQESERADRKMDLRVPEPTAPTARTAFVHEGFYLQFGVGPGMMYTSLVNRATNNSAGSAAFSVAANLLVGGSPAPGLALGVGALANLGLGAKFNGGSSGGQLHLNVGPFLDAFPNRKGGFHVGVLAGASSLSLSTPFIPSSQLWGGGASAWMGWSTWVADEWSAGVQLQTGGSYVTGRDASGGIFHVNLLVNLLNH